jgi:hypothetical protein
VRQARVKPRGPDARQSFACLPAAARAGRKPPHPADDMQSMNTPGTATLPASPVGSTGAARGPCSSAKSGTSGSSTGGGIERRRSTREPVITPGTLRALTDRGQHSLDPGQQVLVTDVSLHGVGFRSHQLLSADTKYTIEIGVGPLHLRSRMRVVRIRRRADGTYDIGAEFC